MDVFEDRNTVDEFDDEEFVSADVKKFRAIAARATYVAMHNSDLEFSTKEMCRSMSAPRVGYCAKLKRLARY